MVISYMLCVHSLHILCIFTLKPIKTKIMKRLLTFLSFLIALLSINIDAKAVTITAIQDLSAWNSPTTWDLGRTPTCGDTIIVPPTMNILINSDVNLNYHDPLCSKVKIVVQGSIRFGNGCKMRLAPGACFVVEEGGMVVPSKKGGGASEYVSIDNERVWQASDGTLPGYASFGCGVILPVIFETIRAEQIDNSIHFEWIVNGERELDYYEIYLSKDGQNWTSLTKIDAIGNSENQETYYYSFAMQDHYDILFYKLQSSDLSGDVNELHTGNILIDLSHLVINNKMDIYPNPFETGKDINIILKNQNNEDAYYSIYDFSGKLIKNESIHLTKGINKVSINIDQTKKGTYMIILNTTEKIYNEKLIMI